MAYTIGNIQNSRQGRFYRIFHQIKCAFAWCCDQTSLHGFHYITSKRSSLLTKLFFACVSCCSFILCTYLIYLQITEHEQQIVMTIVKSTAYPVWKILFPSVIVCNFNVVYKDNIPKVSEQIKGNVSEEIFNDMLYNLSALIINDNLADMSNYETVIEGLNKAGYTTDRLMAELAHPCSSMVKKCFWQNEEIQCGLTFESVRTSQGYCCGFNYYGTKILSNNLQDPNKTQYQRTGGAGPTLGLRLLLDVEEEQYISSIKPSYGINVLVQDGFDYPDMDLIGNTVLSTEELTISVTPKVFVSNTALRHLDYKQRNCLFEDEGNLRWTSTYSYKTCITQCRVNAILQYCNCVPYFYPIENKYNALEIMDDFFTEKKAQNMSKWLNGTIQCNCYPQCNERMFEFHVDRAKATSMEGFKYSNLSVINVYYTTIGCLKTERDVYFTWDRILASIGGIFGLCLGGSIISILECFYFFGKQILNCTTIEEKSPPSKPIYVADFRLYNNYNYRNQIKRGNYKVTPVYGFKNQ